MNADSATLSKPTLQSRLVRRVMLPLVLTWAVGTCLIVSVAYSSRSNSCAMMWSKPIDSTHSIDAPSPITPSMFGVPASKQWGGCFSVM